MTRLTVRLSTAVLAGWILIAATPALAAAGDLDASFGSGGKVTTDFGAGDRANAVIIQSDGKIVAAGSSSGAFPIGDFAVARYNPDGSLDTSFGSGGKVTTDFGADDWANAVAIQSDGKIVAAGTSESPCCGGDETLGLFALARYNQDGTLDSSFGTAGKVTTDFGNYFDSATSVTIQSDGKIVAVGFTGSGVPSSEFTLARYDPDGTLDPSFGSGGKVTTAFSNKLARAPSGIIRSDGEIVAVGSFSGLTKSTSGIAIARYNLDGSLDASFGKGGKVTTSFGSDLVSDFTGALQSHGKIVAAGVFSDLTNNTSGFALARYKADGSLDAKFGSKGTVTTSFGTGGSGGAHSVAIQSDGKIVAAGVDSGRKGGFAIARYRADGSLDTSFGSKGIVTTRFGRGALATSVAIQSDGGIVAAGSASSPDGDFALARYLKGGK